MERVVELSPETHAALYGRNGKPKADHSELIAALEHLCRHHPQSLGKLIENSYNGTDRHYGQTYYFILHAARAYLLAVDLFSKTKEYRAAQRLFEMALERYSFQRRSVDILERIRV